LFYIERNCDPNFVSGLIKQLLYHAKHYGQIEDFKYAGSGFQDSKVKFSWRMKSDVAVINKQNR
jgi:hypothetical protein